MEYIAIQYLIGIFPFGILLLKGKGRLFLVCVVLTLVPFLGVTLAVVNSIRLARPHSWWALHRYGKTKAQKSRVRYPDAPGKPATVLAAFGWIVLLALAPGLGLLALLESS